MLYNELDNIIKQFTLERKTDELSVARSIKNAFVNHIKEGKELTEADEVKILLKMKSQREDSIRQYKEGGREDLVSTEENELRILEKYIPEQLSDEQLSKIAAKAVQEFIDNKGSVSMRDTKEILSKIQAMYPYASGKIVSDEIRKRI